MPVNTPRLTKELAAAYFTTDYIVDNRPNSFRLRAGGLSRQLQLLHSEKGVTCSAYLTACNPFSQPLSSADNELKMNDLKADLEGKWEYQTGEGKDPEGRWPGEPSLLILGIPEEDAHRLAVKYGQFAYLFCKSGSNGSFAHVRLQASDSYDARIIHDIEDDRRAESKDRHYNEKGLIPPSEAVLASEATRFCRNCAERAFSIWKGWCSFGAERWPEEERARKLSLPDIPEIIEGKCTACAGTEVIKPEQIAYENYHSPTNTGLPDYFHLVISAVVAESRWGKPYRESRIGRIPLKLLARHVGDRF